MDPKYQQKLEDITLSSGIDFLTLEEETKIKGFLSTILREDELTLLRKLMSNCNGIEWERPIQECPSQVLIGLRLARYDCGRGERLLKATKFAFLPQIQYLIGLTRSY
jgi:hypothetical protein